MSIAWSGFRRREGEDSGGPGESRGLPEDVRVGDRGSYPSTPTEGEKVAVDTQMSLGLVPTLLDPIDDGVEVNAGVASACCGVNGDFGALSIWRVPL
jgi:hypothetical protein